MPQQQPNWKLGIYGLHIRRKKGPGSGARLMPALSQQQCSLLAEQQSHRVMRGALLARGVMSFRRREGQFRSVRWKQRTPCLTCKLAPMWLALALEARGTLSMHIHPCDMVLLYTRPAVKWMAVQNQISSSLVHSKSSAGTAGSWPVHTQASIYSAGLSKTHIQRLDGISHAVFTNWKIYF